MWQVGDALTTRRRRRPARGDGGALVRSATDLRQPADLWIVRRHRGSARPVRGPLRRRGASRRKRWWPNRRRAPTRRRPPRRCCFSSAASRDGWASSRRPEGLVYQYPAVTVWRASLAVLYAEIGREAKRRPSSRPDRRRPRGDSTRPHLALYVVVPRPHRRQVGSGPEPTRCTRRVVSVADHRAVAGPFFHLGPVAYYLALLAARLSPLGRRRRRGSRRRSAATPRSAISRAPCDLVAWARMRSLRAGAGDAEGGAGAARRRRAIRRPFGHGSDAAQDRHAGESGGGTAAAPAPHVVLRRDGDVWMLAHGRTRVHLRDRRGLHYLVSLLREPGRASSTSSTSPAPATTSAAISDPGSTPPPSRAIATRLRALRAEVEDAEQANDPARAGAARARSTSSANTSPAPVGLGGRNRRVHAASSARRVSVTEGVAGRDRTDRRASSRARRRAARGGAHRDVLRLRAR